LEKNKQKAKKKPGEFDSHGQSGPFSKLARKGIAKVVKAARKSAADTKKAKENIGLKPKAKKKKYSATRYK